MISQRPGAIVTPYHNMRVEQTRSYGVPWWLSGGISAANCIAAYQPKGAASYAASKVNLANPGTYDCVDLVAMDWNASGWIADGTRALNTTVIPTAMSWSYTIAYESAAATNGIVFGAINTVSGIGVNIRPYGPFGSNPVDYQNSTNFHSKLPSGIPSAILGMAGDTAYRNGYDEGISLGNWGAVSLGYPLYIGCINVNNAVRAAYFTGTIIAFSVYNTTLTSNQMLSLATAIAAL